MNSTEREAPAVRPPLFRRETPEQREEFYTLRDGVPEGLRPSLLDWTVGAYASPVGDSWEIDLDRVRHLERVTDRWALLNMLPPSLEFLSTRFSVDDDFLLQATDIALQWAGDNDAEVLESYLADVRSVYCVGKDDNDDFQLQFRQSEEMTKLVQTEIDEEERASDHLRRAWSKCFRVNPAPDPNGTCSDAASAVEAAAKPVISPDNRRTTLGTLLRDMKPDTQKTPGYKWETDSEFGGSIETVFSMMQMVWNKGRYRHGDETAPLEVSQEAAEMTVQTAVLLVSWFRSGRIRLKSQTP